MNTTNSEDILEFAEGGNAKLPQGINVLTILTFIGCGVGALFAIGTPFLLKMSKGFMDKAASMNPDMTDKELAKIERSKHLIDLTQQNIVPLTILGILGVVACLVGALWMRKLKKDGYWLYIAGEILPIIGSFIFLGTAQYADWQSYFGLLVPIVFIILYTVQKKHLVK